MQGDSKLTCHAPPKKQKKNSHTLPSPTKQTEGGEWRERREREKEKRREEKRERERVMDLFGILAMRGELSNMASVLPSDKLVETVFASC